MERRAIEKQLAWIPVSERLPQSSIPYLAVCGGKIILAEWGKNLRGERKWFWLGVAEHSEPIEEVTHWMPLPPLPGEEGEER